MFSESLKRSLWMMAILVVVVLAAWEIYLRNTGVEKSFDDGGPLFASQRAKVYLPKEESTVFIGSSRIKFDLDIDTWEEITGDKAVQLACVGSTPRPVLDDLANDPDFKGKLIIDVTEGLFFSMAPPNFRRPNEGIKYYQEITPAQRASFYLNIPLENTFVFLDKDGFALNALLDKMQVSSRPGVYMLPIFARDFGRTKLNRQDFMGRPFLEDPAQQKQQQDIWGAFSRMGSRFPPVSGPPLDSMLRAVKTSIEKIKARGGEIMFVRTPSSGPYLAGEQKGFPREKYWDRLLVETKCEGIHFLDYPQISNYNCPEFSHLSPADAIDFTKKFIEILKEKGWEFSGAKNL